jgi:quinol monooxygenase YgiN
MSPAGYRPTDHAGALLMSITHVTEFHAASGQEGALESLLTEGRDRMRTAPGCISFDLYRGEDDEHAFTFIQCWVSPEDHDTAFAERIVETGHLQKVLAALGQPLLQHTYTLVT